MPWHRVTHDHWENHSDVHIFFDTTTKCVSTERWLKEPGVAMAVIPIADLIEFLKDNGYNCVSQKEILAFYAARDNLIGTNIELNDSIEKIKEAYSERLSTNRSLTTSLGNSTKTINELFSIIEADTHQIQVHRIHRVQAEKQLNQAKAETEKIVRLAQGEINRLKEEINRLKEKCGEE